MADIHAASVAIDTRPLSLTTRTNARWLMLGLVFVGTVINYLDRTNMSVVAPLISKEFEITPIMMGILF
jgi:ACS family D-galactonate transporter-like MFS transporter